MTNKFTIGDIVTAKGYSGVFVIYNILCAFDRELNVNTYKYESLSYLHSISTFLEDELTLCNNPTTPIIWRLNIILNNTKSESTESTFRLPIVPDIDTIISKLTDKELKQNIQYIKSLGNPNLSLVNKLSQEYINRNLSNPYRLFL